MLEEATKHQAIDDIIDVALKRYPKEESLHLAKENRLLTVTLPFLEDAEWNPSLDEGQLEVIIGNKSTLVPASFLGKGHIVARSVGKVILASNSRGSGFLIANNLFVTNNHVIPSEEVASQAIIEFSSDDETRPFKEKFHLDPKAFFRTSDSEKTAAAGNDWTIVKVKKNPNKTWGAIPIRPINLQPGERALIIQHPGGEQKKIGVFNSIVTAYGSLRIQYLTDTSDGSSGAPVFNKNWELIGVHHRGGVVVEHSGKRFLRNQGININLIQQALYKEGMI